MTTIFAHPAVAQYLSELDEALRNSPVHGADELRDQVRTHVGDAVGPHATDQEVEATLRRPVSSAVLRFHMLGVTRTEHVQIGMAFSVSGHRVPGHRRYGATVLEVRR